MKKKVRAGLLSALLASGCGARSDLPVGAGETDETQEPPPCGDGVLADDEGCDDGNTVDLDGCSSDCRLETCGDGIVDPGEECDEPGSPDAACSPLCRLNRCGDGVVHVAVEDCDLGPDNADQPAILVTQGSLERPLRPLEIDTDVVSFYAYESYSAHTGLEQEGNSRVIFSLSRGVDALSLITVHGLDIDSTGTKQPEGDVVQSLSGLPGGWFIAVTDDRPEEFFAEDEDEATGNWEFNQNTDGGAIGGLPFPGSWSIEIESSFFEGISIWEAVDGNDVELIALDASFDTPATFTAFLEPSACSTRCKFPRCGDDYLDGGEVCDDGNTLDGDGCRADCKATELLF